MLNKRFVKLCDFTGLFHDKLLQFTDSVKGFASGSIVQHALNALTKAVESLTAKTTTEYLNGFETIYEPPSEEETPKEQPTPESQTVTFVQLRSRLSEISRNGYTAEVKALIAKYGAERLSDLNESDYAALLAEAEGLV